MDTESLRNLKQLPWPYTVYKYEGHWILKTRSRYKILRGPTFNKVVDRYERILRVAVVIYVFYWGKAHLRRTAGYPIVLIPGTLSRNSRGFHHTISTISILVASGTDPTLEPISVPLVELLHL